MKGWAYVSMAMPLSDKDVKFISPRIIQNVGGGRPRSLASSIIFIYNEQAEKLDKFSWSLHGATEPRSDIQTFNVRN